MSMTYNRQIQAFRHSLLIVKDRESAATVLSA